LSTEELMVAADRAMYQAKSLGKNQISGNPRPRKVAAKLLAAPDELVVDEVAAEDAAPPAASAAEKVLEPTPAPPEPTATAFTVEAVTTNGAKHDAHHEAHGEDEPDPADVRRHIAAARRNMDPDHQIRRAMDAFLSSPTTTRADRDRAS
jgi:hypothetical protein